MVAASATLFSATLPALVIVIVSVTPTPGIVFTAAGLLVSVTASIAGIVNVTVCVLVIVLSVVLVAVTWKVRTVPGAGSGWPALGTR